MVQALTLLIAIAADLPLGKVQRVPAAEAKELLRSVCPGPLVEGKDDDNKGEWGCPRAPRSLIQNGQAPGIWRQFTTGISLARRRTRSRLR